jgi:glutathione S-transferase
VPRSRTFRCIWAAEEAGQPYELVPVGFDGAMKTEAYAALNPNRTIPTMQDGALTLFESLAINLHIAGKAGPPLMPRPGADDAARVLQWTLWAATEAEPNIMQWAYNAFMRPPEQRDPVLAAAGAEASRKRLGVLETLLADRTWLLGTDFTIADCNIAGVYYASWLNGFEFGGFPKTKAWLDACLNRPAALMARKLREG